MKPKFPHIAEVIIRPKVSQTSFAETFIYEPDNVEEEKLGYIYILGEVKAKETQKNTAEPTIVPAAVSFLNLIASQFSNSFYKRTRFLPKEAFEQSLREINVFISQLYDNQKLTWLEELNLGIILFASKQSKLCFAVNGKVQGILWRKGKISDITASFISSQTQDLSGNCFQKIADGEVQLGDKLIFSAPFITRKIEPVKLKILIDKLQHQNLGLLSNYIAHDDSEALAIIAIDIKKTPPVPEKKESSPQIQTKNSALKAPHKSLKMPKISLKKIVLSLGAAIILLKKSYSWLKKYIYLPIKKAIGKLTEKSSAKRKTSVRKKSLLLFKNLSQVSLLALAHAKRHFSKKQPQINKKAFKAIILIIVGALSLIFFVRLFSHKAPATSAPSDQREVSLQNLVPLVDLGKRTLDFTPLGVIINKPFAIFYDKDSFYIFDFNALKGKFLFPQLSSQESFTLQAELPQKFIYFADPNKAVILSKDAKIETSATLKKIKGETVKDIATFEDNLYLLTASGKILKYSHLNFSQPSLWLNNGSDLGQNYISFAIDGSIYLLSKSGVIHKYQRGKLVPEFLLTAPVMAQPGDKLLTRSTFKNIYFLSRSQHKIFIFNKEKEALVKIVTSPVWKNTTSFYVTPDEKAIYLIDSLSLYKIPI